MHTVEYLSGDMCIAWSKALFIQLSKYRQNPNRIMYPNQPGAW